MRTVLSMLVAAVLAAASGLARAEPPAQPPSPIAGDQAPALTATDLEAWLDGLAPYALRQGDIGGLVVVVVKDGQVLLAKGYGYADVAAGRPVDPQSTLFRGGSISKLFTWTAVMQLVEQGRLDLDRDVNAYLDFRIPPFEGAPITLRQLMTHTAGFEEHVRYMDAPTASRLMDFETFERTQTPARIFPSGKVPAYSNYGAGLAAYIVERVSGEPFGAYVQRHILAPLGMTHTSFAQPLPASLRADMSKGYPLGSGPSRPFELINPPPAGAISISGADAARFMIAHLQNGRLGDAQILTPQAAATMHATSFRAAPPLNGMTLGFFEEDRNGHRVIGHGGDLNYFHSDLHLLPGDGVGLFVSMNSAGRPGANTAIRRSLFTGFMDRYFPAPVPREPTWKDARTDGRRIAGYYELSRRAQTSLLTVQTLLQQVQVSVDGAGLVSIPVLDAQMGSPPRKWREVGPLTWREVGGKSLLKALTRDGRVVALVTDDIPQFTILQPTPWWRSPAWSAPVFAVAIGVLVLTVLLWPIAALVRRRFRAPFPLSGRRAAFYRLSRLGALASLLFLAAWIALFAASVLGLIRFDAAIDPWLRGAQVIGLVAMVGAALAVLNAVVVWADRSSGWWARISAPLVALACLAVVWFALAGHALNRSLVF